MICALCYDVSEKMGAYCGACGKSPLLNGRYRLEGQVGQGASARTYRAVRVGESAGDEQVVAIKELLFHRIDALKTLELFEREARVLRQLSHPGIPKYVETFQIEDGRNLCFYLVQEFIEGQSLLAEMDSRRFDEQAVLEFLVELAGPVGYLHGLPVSVVHRDIKPANIMRRAVDGQVMLIDFGTVRDVFNPQGQGNTVAGTFGYMAPEQMMGESTPACDVYGIGATAVALLTGQDVLSAEQRLAWLGKMNLTEGVRQLLLTMLDERAERRPTTGAVRDRAQAILSGREKVAALEHGVLVGNVSWVGHGWSGRVDLADREEDERLVEAASAAFRGRGEMQVQKTADMIMAENLIAIEEYNKQRQPWVVWGTIVMVVVLGSAIGFTQISIDNQRKQARSAAVVAEPAEVELTEDQSRRQYFFSDKTPSATNGYVPSPGPATVHDPMKSLGRFTLGMTVEEAYEASGGTLWFVGDYQAKAKRMDSFRTSTPYIGKTFEVLETFGKIRGQCALNFVVGNRVSEIQCRLVVPAQTSDAYFAHERMLMESLGVDYETTVSTEPLFPHMTDRVWARGDARLGMVSGPGLERGLLASDPDANLFIWLESSEHTLARQAALDAYEVQRQAEK